MYKSKVIHCDETMLTMCVGSFKNGVAEGEVDGALEELSAMRLLVHSDSDVWVLLSEVNHIHIIYI